MPRSYYLPSFYSPIGWQSWADIAMEIENAEGNYSKTKTLWNTTYGLPWNDITVTPKPDELWERRSRAYRMRQVPEWVLFLAAGVDIGIDHIEVGVLGFGRNGRRCLIEHIRIRGRKDDRETWEQLEGFLQRRYLHPWGAVLPIRKVGVDRAKWRDIIDPWVRRQNPDWIVAVNGRDEVDTILKEAFRRDKQEDGLWSEDKSYRYFKVGIALLKLELYSHLGLRLGKDGEPPPGWIDLPEDVTLEWCEQLVSEEYVTVQTKGKRPKSVWKPIGALRHEAMDTTNYARAMAALYGWDYWSEADYQREETKLRQAAEDLRMAMERRARKGALAGDRRPVRIDDVVSNLVRALGDEPEEHVSDAPLEEYKETAANGQIAAEADDEEEDDDEGGLGWGQYLRNGGAGENGVERPAGPGIVGCTDSGKGWSIPRRGA